MGKVKEEIQNLKDTCERLYQIGGASAVIDYIEEGFRQGQEMVFLNVVYERCDACDADMPSIDSICLICGQPTTPKLDKQQLVDAVIDDLRKGFELGDYTVLDELLNKLSIKTLVQSLPEEEWDKYKEINNSYFEIMYQDFNEDAGREEIQIHAGENGNVYLFQDGDKLGFIVDVYGQNDIVDTMTVWEDDLNPDDDDDEEESNDPRNFSDVEIEEWKENWGQTHSGITAELGYSRKHNESDGLLMEDYFWVEKDKRWYNRHASGFTPREQAIADYLYACSTYQNLNE